MAAGDIHAFPNTEEGITMRPPAHSAHREPCTWQRLRGGEAAVERGLIAALFVAMQPMYLDLFGKSWRGRGVGGGWRLGV